MSKTAKKQLSTLDNYTLVRGALDTVSKGIRFDPRDHVPLCSEKCPHHDGKRCRVTGNEPEQVCRPGCAILIKALMVLDTMILG